MAQKKNLALIAARNLKSLIKSSPYKTQDKFAEAMHVDPTTVRKWLKNGINKLDLLQEIADVFDMDPMDILRN